MRNAVSYPRRYLATLISLSVLGTSLPTVTLAQDQDDDSFLEELVVTARRREENIQDVPISISAFSEQTLRDFNAVGLEDIAELTPGVQFREIGGTPEITMRGLAQTDLLGLQANVGVFIDGVFLNNRSSIDFNNMDLQQIEVLKGPQSALFGRNTFAGAVNYISNPARIGEFDATLDLEAGSDERLTFRGSANVPLGESAAVRFFAGTSEFDGTIDNVRGSDNIGGWDERTTIGFSALWETENVTTKVFFTRNDVENDTPALRLTSFELNNGGSLYRVDDGMGGTTDLFTILTGDLPNLENVTLDPRARGNKGDYWLGYINVDWDLGPATLTANVSRSESEYSSFLDSIGDPNAVNIPFFGRFTRQFLTDLTGDLGEQDSYDLRLTSNEGAPFEWLVGYSRFESVTGAVLGTTTPLFEDPDTLERITNVEERLIADIDAFYGSVNYPVNDRWNITGELRYTQEDQELTDQAEIFFLPALSRPLTSTATDFDYWSGRLGADYSLDEDTLLYGYAARGVKSGGINPAEPGSQFFTFDPETNWTYELGIKTDIMDGRGTINAAVYFIDWTDLQSTAPASLAAGPVVVNGPGAESMGIEVDGSFDVTDNFTVRLAATYVDATYDGDFVDAAVEARCGVNLSPLTPVSTCSAQVGGNQIANTSDVQTFIAGIYTWPDLFSGYDGYIQASHSYEAGRFLESLNVGQTPSISLLNFRTGIRGDSSELSLWVDNLLDEEFLARATRVTDAAANALCLNCGISSNQRIAGNGRTWGVRYVKRF